MSERCLECGGEMIASIRTAVKTPTGCVLDLARVATCVDCNETEIRASIATWLAANEALVRRHHDPGDEDVQR